MVSRSTTPLKVVLGADGQLHGHDLRGRRILQAGDGSGEVGALAVQHVAEQDAGPGRARSARAQRRSVWTSTPSTRVDHDERRLDHAQRGDGVGQEAGVAGGVDEVEGEAVALDVRQRPAERLSWRFFSSSSQSETVVPSSTLPRRLTTPARYSSASRSDVLPVPRWPTSAMFLILPGSFILALLCRLGRPGRTAQTRATAASRAAICRPDGSRLSCRGGEPPVDRRAQSPTSMMT